MGGWGQQEGLASHGKCPKFYAFLGTLSPASYITFRDIIISNMFQMELLSAVIHVEQGMRDFDIEQIEEIVT